jgi:hypothetical protein
MLQNVKGSEDDDKIDGNVTQMSEMRNTFKHHLGDLGLDEV